jgi:UDP-hydrolysing UDP-N-acetyl-D-glucosamine 2-epimerase
MNKKKILIVLVDRANYGRMKPVMQALRDDPRFEISIVCTGAMLLERFGRSVDVVRADGFEVQHEIYMEVEGSLPVTMVASMGVGLIEFARIIDSADPDFVLMIGDRYQAMSAAIAATFQNKCLIHIQGGEVSGSIDESTRHAITKLAHYHFPSTQRAGAFIERMGEGPETVFPLGCPSADIAAMVPDQVPQTLSTHMGVGIPIDFDKPYTVALFHPVTTDISNAEQQMNNLLQALNEVGGQVVMIWPNIDAGSDRISKAIRQFREQSQDGLVFHAYKNLEPDVYLPLIKSAQCLVGNSSSFLRDASFFGTPVVLVGDRQANRERSEAVFHVAPEADQIAAAIRQQIAHGTYPSSTMYGSPGVSRAIADQIAKLTPYSQKTLSYLR